MKWKWKYCNLFVWISHQFSSLETIFMVVFNASLIVPADCHPENRCQGREQGWIIGQCRPQAQRRWQKDLRWQRIFEADRTSNSNIAATSGKKNKFFFLTLIHAWKFLSFQQKSFNQVIEKSFCKPSLS